MGARNRTRCLGKGTQVLDVKLVDKFADVVKLVDSSLYMDVRIRALHDQRVRSINTGGPLTQGCLSLLAC